MGGIIITIIDRVKKVIDKVVNYGATPDLTLQQQKLVTITNKFALFTDFIVFSSIFLDYYHGFYMICILKSFLVPLLFLAIYFNHQRFRFIGKNMLVIIASSIVFVLDGYFGKESGVYNYYLMNLTGVSFLYTMKERRTLFLAYLFSALLIGISIVTDHSLFLNTSISPEVLEELYTNNFVYMSLLLIYYAYTVVDTNFRYEAQLLEQQQKLMDGEKRLNETLQMKDSILEVMAHDLRNPLNTILGNSDLLKAKIKMGIPQSENDILRSVQKVEQAVTHSTNIINNLLQLHEFEQTNKVIARQKILLRNIIDDVVENTSPFAETKGVKIQILVGDTMIEVNPTRFERVLENLIINSIKFSKQGDEVVIKAHTEMIGDSHWIVVSVTDCGIGIPDDLKEHLFDFLTSSKRVGTNGEQSTGMGLSITKKLVEMNGGILSYESMEDRGTTFFIKLPGIVQ